MLRMYLQASQHKNSNHGNFLRLMYLQSPDYRDRIEEDADVDKHINNSVRQVKFSVVNTSTLHFRMCIFQPVIVNWLAENK